MTKYNYILIEFNDMDFKKCLDDAVEKFANGFDFISNKKQEEISDIISKYTFGFYCIQQGGDKNNIDIDMLDYFYNNIKISTFLKFPENPQGILHYSVNIHTGDFYCYW